MLPFARAGIRFSRVIRPQPGFLYAPSRSYAKVGKPKPAEFKHVASNVATPRGPDTAEKILKQSEAIKTDRRGKSSAPDGVSTSPLADSIPTSNTQAKSSTPKSQDELDAEALDAMPKTSESKSQSAVGEQAEHETSQRIPLHDITKGIPSTLDAELREAARRQQAAEQGEEAEPESSAKPMGGRGGQGDRPVRDYTTSAERRRNRLMGWVLGSMGLLVLVGPMYLGRNWESEEEAEKHANAPNGWGLQLFYNRFRARTSSTLDYYNEPAFPKLLPDVDPQFERPYTLVLSLKDLLIHGEWTREHGWRIAKRPGLDYFIRYLQSYYELVIFTSEPSMIGVPVLQKLDPFGIVPWRLFREATRYKDGKHIKDLSFLNRPLDKIILIDTDASHAEAQPENAIILPKWTGDPNDQELIALIPFLEYTAAMGLADTRKVLESFKDKHIPTEFAIREAQARKIWNEQRALEKRSRRGGIGAIGSALGIKPDLGPQIPGQTTISEGLAKGLMFHDIIRETGQKQYELFEKQIRDNQDVWMEEIKKDEERMREESMKQMKQGVSGWFGLGSSKPSSETAEKK